MFLLSLDFGVVVVGLCVERERKINSMKFDDASLSLSLVSAT